MLLSKSSKVMGLTPQIRSYSTGLKITAPEYVLKKHKPLIAFGPSHRTGRVSTGVHPLGPLPGSVAIPLASVKASTPASVGSIDKGQLEPRFQSRLIEQLEIDVIEMGGAFPDPPKPDPKKLKKK